MIILCALLSLPPAAAGPAQSLPAAIAAELDAQGLQGAVWSTLEADGRVTLGAHGVKDARDGSRLAPADRVHVGSIAKTVLAAGVLRLVSEGRFELDTPVSELLPEVPIDNPWAATHRMTVRHLLDHTAGLDDARFSQVFSLTATADTPLQHALARAGLPLTVRSRPGARHSYSNTGYLVLGMLVEKTTAMRYERYLDTRVLAPLGMADSTAEFTTQAGEATDRRLALGHFENGVGQPAVPSYLRPAGQFTTTAGDMARLARFLMSDGRIDGAPFIDRRLLDAMGRPDGTEAADAGLGVGYGLGLSTRDRHGAVGKCHGGSTVGFQAMLCMFPEQRQAFFVSVNTDSETASYGRLDELFVRALGLRSADAPPVAAAPMDASPWLGFYVPSPNRFARLAWLDETLNFARLRRHAGGLVFSSLHRPDVALTPESGALFKASDRTIGSHVLLRAADGKRVLSTGTQSFEQVSLPRLMGLWASLAAGLLGLLYVVTAGVGRAVAGRTRWLGRDSIPAMLAGRRGARLDVAARAAVLQLCAVLAAWGLLPLRLWA